VGFEALVNILLAKLTRAMKIMRGRTGRSVGLQSGDETGLGNFIWSAVLHIHSSKEKYIALFCDTRRNSLHDFAIDGLFVVCNQVLIQKLLNLVGREPGESQQKGFFYTATLNLHPADILNDLDIIQGCLLQLKKLCCLLLKS
jgi:hypothetical protein